MGPLSGSGVEARVLARSRLTKEETGDGKDHQLCLPLP